MRPRSQFIQSLLVNQLGALVSIKADIGFIQNQQVFKRRECLDCLVRNDCRPGVLILVRFAFCTGVVLDLNAKCGVLDDLQNICSPCHNFNRFS